MNLTKFIKFTEEKNSLRVILTLAKITHSVCIHCMRVCASNMKRISGQGFTSSPFNYLSWEEVIYWVRHKLCLLHMLTINTTHVTADN